MRSASGMNSLQSRITSGVQRSAASEAWAPAGFVPTATIKTVSIPAMTHKIERDWMSRNMFKLSFPC
jgi:hypothetical protein